MSRSEFRGPAAVPRIANGRRAAAPRLNRRRPAAAPGFDRHRRAALAAILGTALVAAGCATPAPTSAPAEGRSWLGRFAVTWTPDAQPPRQERASGRFTLRELGERTELEVFSPFGQTVARASSRPGSTVLETADGRRYEADNPELLTESVLGWRAPVQSLPKWLSATGPDHLVQAGWDVRVEARENGLPRRLTLSWPAEIVATSWRQVTIRLVLDDAGETAADGAR